MLDKYAYYYWINRNKEMVLSFRRYGSSQQENSERDDSINVGSAFFTNNGQFLAEFGSQFDARWKESFDGGTEVIGDYCYSNHQLTVSLDSKNRVHYQ